MGAHLPYRPPQDYVNKFASDISKDKHAYKFMTRFNADAARWASPSDPPLQEWERAVIDGFYQAEIAHQDYHLGRLLRYLKESGALEDTMVVIAADHGEGHGDHDFFGHSFVVYQELVHVPLAISYPDRFPTGKRINTNVSTRRIFHTILEAVGITPPIDEADPNANVRDLSLISALNGKPDTENGLVFAEAFPPQTFINLIQHRKPELIERLYLNTIRRGIYDGQHKLAVAGDHIEGLFNVNNDPDEIHDVSSQNSDLATMMHSKLHSFVKSAEHFRADGMAFAGVDAEIENHLRALGYIE